MEPCKYTSAFLAEDKETFFAYEEYNGRDRRYAVLEIEIEDLPPDRFRGEVFDTMTGQTVWKGRVVNTEAEAMARADEILTKLEEQYGFGSIILYGPLAQGAKNYKAHLRGEVSSPEPDNCQ